MHHKTTNLITLGEFLRNASSFLSAMTKIIYFSSHDDDDDDDDDCIDTRTPYINKIIEAKSSKSKPV